MTDSETNPGTASGQGYVVPITGLLALLFALLAGASAYPAISSGSIGLAAMPLIFVGASVLCLRLRQKYLERGQ